ncbi:minichromosome maintenance protein MCM [Halolamina salina]|uniref:DNA helicase n=1 Tax=Halolamina salina TaxID=1220023 RepID=A0ABD6B9S3_9EURY
MPPKETQELTERFTQFYQHFYEDEIEELADAYPNDRRSLYISYTDLFTFDRDLAEDYQAKPARMREYAEEALRQYTLSADVSLHDVHVRLHSLPTEHERRLTDIRSDDLNDLIRISGTVESTSRIKSRVVEAAFECQRCGTMTYIPQPAFGEKEPHECQGCERQGPFEIHDDQSEIKDFQRARILERTPGDGDELNRESIVIHLADDLVDELTPGETASITGILTRISDSNNYYDATIHDKFIDVVSTADAAEYPHLTITDEDIAAIVELSNDPDVIEKISQSIAPTVYGYDQGKQALAMQLFGGVTKRLPDDSLIRGDIHLLFIGDPATAKTTLLKAASNLAPRSVNVNGAQSTKVGITAAATPSSGESDPWELQAGAIVLADHGLACIDHLDGLPEDAQIALEGPMAQQVLNMSKASVTETLPAEASVLATANPKYGRFDQYEPIGKQIDLMPGLISRFDLIFTFTDQPDPEHDSELAEHVLTTNQAGEITAQQENWQNGEVPDSAAESIEAVTPAIDAELLRKYIAYAKRNVYPTMSEAAKEAIEEFYVDMRAKGADEDAPVPVSARKLEGLVRLAEASARMRLSDTVEERDAERVIEIVRSTLEDIGVDPDAGEFDAEVVETGASKSQRDRIKSVKALIGDIEEEYDAGAPIEEVFDRAGEVGMSVDKVQREIESLRNKGELYEPVEDHLRTT